MRPDCRLFRCARSTTGSFQTPEITVPLGQSPQSRRNRPEEPPRSPRPPRPLRSPTRNSPRSLISRICRITCSRFMPSNREPGRVMRSNTLSGRLRIRSSIDPPRSIEDVTTEGLPEAGCPGSAGCGLSPLDEGGRGPPRDDLSLELPGKTAISRRLPSGVSRTILFTAISTILSSLTLSPTDSILPSMMAESPRIASSCGGRGVEGLLPKRPRWASLSNFAFFAGSSAPPGRPGGPDRPCVSDRSDEPDCVDG